MVNPSVPGEPRSMSLEAARASRIIAAAIVVGALSVRRFLPTAFDVVAFIAGVAGAAGGSRAIVTSSEVERSVAIKLGV